MNKNLKNLNVLIGCSGGPDSVAILFLFHKFAKKRDIKLYVAHVNYNLRGNESIEDMNLVQNHSKALNLPLFILNTKYQSGNIQAWAREERFKFFDKIMSENKINYLALGHNLEDQSETIIQNLIRGTGTKGIIGMQIKEGNIIRPLLNISRQEIIDYLNKNNIKFRIDNTNLQTKYTRNKIRYKILPILKEINPKALEHIYNTSITQANLFNKQQNEFQKLFNESIITKNSFLIKLKTSFLMKLNKIFLSDFFIFILKKIDNSFKDYSKVQIDELTNLFLNKNYFQKDIKRQIFIIKSKNYVTISKKIPDVNKQIDNISKINLLNKEISFEILKNNETYLRKMKYLRNQLFVDMSKIKFPIFITNNHNQKIQLLNTNIHKKLKDILSDKGYNKFERKLILNFKDSTNIICSEYGIVNNLYKITENTKEILLIEIKELK